MNKTIRIIANLLASENDMIIIKCLSSGILDIYDRVFVLSDWNLKREVMFGLSNIACHSEQINDHFVEHDVFTTV